jgi:aryl-alcohol dehydrogenase-like predicted oxidoreductase
MRTAQLGSQGPEITRVGFGGWAVGGTWAAGWGPQDDDDSIAAIRRAIELGVNWIDTAAVYGLGHSEEIVRRAIEPYEAGRDVFVFTKCGRSWYASDGREIVYDLRPASIRFECERSLERLGVERIDLYQIHWPDHSGATPVEEAWATMAELQAEDKVRFIGASNFSVDQLERCAALHHVDSAQPSLSLLQRAARTDVVPWCREHGTGVIVYSPMGSGLLTGRFDRERLAALPRDDWRSRAANFNEPRVSANLALVERLRPIAVDLRCTVAALSVAWTLSVPGVTGAIVGARRPEQVDEWAPAADLDLREEALAAIEEAVRETGAGEESATPAPTGVLRAVDRKDANDSVL